MVDEVFRDEQLQDEDEVIKRVAASATASLSDVGNRVALAHKFHVEL